jgi:hypothetical protein
MSYWRVASGRLRGCSLVDDWFTGTGQLRFEVQTAIGVLRKG